MDNEKRIEKIKEKEYQELFGVKKSTFDKKLEILGSAYKEFHENGGHPPRLSEFDEHYNIHLHEITNPYTSDLPRKQIGVSFNRKILNDFMSEWLLRKQELAEGLITKEEYQEWKLNWPQTADDCGKFTPSKKWRKGNCLC